MHESTLVADLIASVESEVDPAKTRVLHLTVRIGALSTLSLRGLRQGIEHRAALAWGYSPEVEIQDSDDLDDPSATGVRLVSIRVED